MDPDRVSGSEEVQEHISEIFIHGLVGTPGRAGVLVPLGALVPGRAALVEDCHVVEARPQNSLAVVEVPFFAVAGEDGDAVHLQ